MFRAFLAFNFLDSHPQISSSLQFLREKIPEARWVKPEQFHLTLHFFGNISSQAQKRIEDLVRDLTNRTPPMKLAFGGLGVFPSFQAAKILWLGIKDGSEILTDFQKKLSERIESAGFSIEEREFKPHLTLARFKKPLFISKDLLSGLDLTAQVYVSELNLIQSTLTPEGSEYKILQKFPLLKSISQ